MKLSLAALLLPAATTAFWVPSSSSTSSKTALFGYHDQGRNVFPKQIGPESMGGKAYGVPRKELMTPKEEWWHVSKQFHWAGPSNSPVALVEPHTDGSNANTGAYKAQNNNYFSPPTANQSPIPAGDRQAMFQQPQNEEFQRNAAAAPPPASFGFQNGAATAPQTSAGFETPAAAANSPVSSGFQNPAVAVPPANVGYENYATPAPPTFTGFQNAGGAAAAPEPAAGFQTAAAAQPASSLFPNAPAAPQASTGFQTTAVAAPQVSSGIRRAASAPPAVTENVPQSVVPPMAPPMQQNQGNGGENGNFFAAPQPNQTPLQHQSENVGEDRYGEDLMRPHMIGPESLGGKGRSPYPKVPAMKAPGPDEWWNVSRDIHWRKRTNRRTSQQAPNYRPYAQELPNNGPNPPQLPLQRTPRVPKQLPPQASQLVHPTRHFTTDDERNGYAPSTPIRAGNQRTKWDGTPILMGAERLGGKYSQDLTPGSDQWWDVSRDFQWEK